MGHVAHNEHEHGAGGIAADDGQEVNLRTEVKPQQEDHIVQQRRRRAENAVHRHQAVQLAAAHQLAGEGAQAAHQYIDVKIDGIVGEDRHQLQKRVEQQHQDKAAEHRGQAAGVHLAAAVVFVQPKAQHSIADAQAHQRNEQVCALAGQLGNAHFLHLAHGVGDEGLNKQSKQLA